MTRDNSKTTPKIECFCRWWPQTTSLSLCILPEFSLVFTSALVTRGCIRQYLQSIHPSSVRNILQRVAWGTLAGFAVQLAFTKKHQNWQVCHGYSDLRFTLNTWVLRCHGKFYTAYIIIQQHHPADLAIGPGLRGDPPGHHPLSHREHDQILPGMNTDICDSVNIYVNFVTSTRDVGHALDQFLTWF